MKTVFTLTLCALLMATSTAAYAQPSSSNEGGNRGQEQGERKGPPPEAFTVCENQSVGASCQMTTPHGDMAGTCQMPKGDKLVCAPEGRENRDKK